MGLNLPTGLLWPPADRQIRHAHRHGKSPCNRPVVTNLPDVDWRQLFRFFRVSRSKRELRFRCLNRRRATFRASTRTVQTSQSNTHAHVFHGEMLPMVNAKFVPPRPGRPADAGQTDFDELKRLIHGKLVDKLDLTRLGDLEGDTLRREIRLVVEHLCDTENPLLNRSEREKLIEEVLDETFGFGPLEALLKEDGVADIMINGPKNIFLEKNGRIQRSKITFRDNDHLMQILDRIVSKVGRRIDETSPMCDARLPDGSRVNAIIPPLALDGPAITIRRFGSNPLTLEDLLRFGAFTPEMVMLLEGAIKARLNMIVSGGTGSGKTTLLNTLSSFIQADQRVITIEDAAELQLQQEHVLRLETRPANIEGKGRDQRDRPGA